MEEEKIILNDSPEAAQQKQLTLWVSRDGLAFADERTARYHGCTHVRCECGGIAKKGRIYCDACQSKRDEARYLAMPEKEWDGETPVVGFNDDHYFFDDGEIADYCEDNEMKEEDLQLVICEPCFATEIDPGEHYVDDLPEDGEMPDELQAAFDELNKKIREYKKPISWFPGKFRTTIKSA